MTISEKMFLSVVKFGENKSTNYETIYKWHNETQDVMYFLQIFDSEYIRVSGSCRLATT